MYIRRPAGRGRACPCIYSSATAGALRAAAAFVEAATLPAPRAHALTDAVLCPIGTVAKLSLAPQVCSSRLHMG